MLAKGTSPINTCLEKCAESKSVSIQTETAYVTGGSEYQRIMRTEIYAGRIIAANIGSAIFNAHWLYRRIN